MNMLETNPTLYQKISDNHIDYSEMYRTQETLQLNKRLRKTRIALLISAFVLIAGGAVLLLMPETSFTITNLLGYTGVGVIFVILSFVSNKQPFISVVAALVVCLGLWGFEVFSDSTSGLIIETSIHKLLIISLLVWRFHPSREAELIRRELDFS
jgi:hypothetical protein